MHVILQKYLNQLATSVSGVYCFIQHDVKERLLKSLPPSQMDSSLKGGTAWTIDMYGLARKLPTAPVGGDQWLNDYVRDQCLLVIIAAYEWLKDALPISAIESEGQMVKLLKCLRDAAAHQNKFCLRDKRFLPLKWHEKELTEADHEQELFSRWMSPGDIPILFDEVDREVAHRLR